MQACIYVFLFVLVCLFWFVLVCLFVLVGWFVYLLRLCVCLFDLVCFLACLIDWLPLLNGMDNENMHI